MMISCSAARFPVLEFAWLSRIPASARTAPGRPRSGGASLPEAPKRPVVRLSDVAKRAQCSAATVSRVLNAPETVNAEARLRVEAAVRDLGYTRNAAARALRSRRSQIIGIILPTLKYSLYADFVEGAQAALARRDHSLLIASSDYSPERELFQARLLAERGIDGLVLIGDQHLPGLVELLDSQDLPSVSTYTSRGGVTHPLIGFDNAAAMAKVIDHLHGLGHRDIAVAAGPRAMNDRVEERIAGATARLQSLGVALRAERILEVPLSVAGGREAVCRLADAGPMPTALVCTSDVLAFGAQIECRARAIPVPGALSVTGFDDLPPSAHMFPALTTIVIPSEEMGRRAAEHLMARLAGQDPPGRVLLAAHLVVRETTAPPAGAGTAPW